MRIRKRQVPLPLSSLLPVPLSDLYFNRSPATTDGDEGDGGIGVPPPHPPSDVSDELIRRWGVDFSDHGAHDDDEKDLNEEEKAALDNTMFGEGEESEEEVGSENVGPDPETASGNPSLESGSPPQQEGQKVVPLKRRRGTSSEENNSKTKACRASVSEETKMKKHVGDIKKAEAEHAGMAPSRGRKKGRGASSLAEGSRCSRVNGRGWRCCQQTRQGYSLCQHHLGKGRLRSRKGHAKKKEITKKRAKLGMVVKARSISSLLVQTSGAEITSTTDHYGGGDK
ncbi:PREDICTED: uncharacterized protein LOC104824476 [Tarenaya hassleriana]|uniref:uncharacterized protein LOC104824476 n=1 Tax=Tarenaya hassleriana TaxID=28532 RepID=UPI00053C9573|nr:PREDICTED: uncharacterized protein LOC104824476 [Tarenaya hassleriana]